MMRTITRLKLSNSVVPCSTCTIQSKLNTNLVDTSRRKIPTTQSLPLFEATVNLDFLSTTVASTVILGIFSQAQAKENVEPDLNAAKRQTTETPHKTVKRLKGKGRHISGLTLDERITAARPFDCR